MCACGNAGQVRSSDSSSFRGLRRNANLIFSGEALYCASSADRLASRAPSKPTQDVEPAMAAAPTIDWTIGQVLLVEVIGLACLLALLRIRRAVRMARQRSSALQPMATSPAVRLFETHPFPSPAEPAQLVTPIFATSRPILVSAADFPPTDAQPVDRPRSPSPVVPSAQPARKRPRPLREVEETVLSPQSLLARAQEFLDAGNADEAATQLRLCIRLSSKLKEARTEARARLELGDIARASGDLTTACEHWQLARALFADVHQPAELHAAEARMERAGCPTDWVLTQF
jgi:hypothetical protein